MEPALFKIIIAAATVVALAEIAKRVDPVLSGILLGLPLGAGLSVYFVALEQGVGFIVSGLPWAIAGLCSALIFCTVYLLAGRRLSGGRVANIAIASIVALVAFFLSGAAVRSQDWTAGSASIAFLMVAAGNAWFLCRFPSAPGLAGNKPIGWRGLLLRGVIAGLIITSITMAAPLAGSQWTGILSSFPSTLYALLVIVHFETGNALYPGIILSFARSAPALAVFYIGCMILLPLLGLNRGFLVVYAISAGYVYLTHRVVKLSTAWQAK